MRTLLLLTFCFLLAAGPALAQNGGSRRRKPDPTPEERDSTSNTRVRPPIVVPPPTGRGGTRSNTTPRPPRSSTTTSGSGSSLRLGEWKARDGFYLGLRGDLGGATGISIDPMAGPQLLEIDALDPNGEPFVDAEGNEIGSSSTSNWGVTVGSRFPGKWGLQMGYDQNRVVYHAINNYPFASAQVGGQLSAWELPYTQHAAHFGVEKAFRGPLKLAHLFGRMGLRAEWYRDGRNNVDPGSSNWLENGTGAVWENNFTNGPTYVLTPEFGWHIGKRFQFSFTYHIPLSAMATHTYTYYENDEVVGANQLRVSSQQFAVRLHWDVLHLPAFQKKTPEPVREDLRWVPPTPEPEVVDEPEPLPDPEPVPDPTPQVDPPAPPAIEFDCSSTAAYTLKKVHFRVSEPVFLDAAAAQEELDALVHVLESCDQINVEVSGHTDSRGLEKKNLALSRERAKVVRKYLISRGISRWRIKAIGYGSKRPVASNADEEGRRKNRRVEIRIIR